MARKKRTPAVWTWDADAEWLAGLVVLARFRDGHRDYAARLTPEQALELSRKLESVAMRCINAQQLRNFDRLLGIDADCDEMAA